MGDRQDAATTPSGADLIAAERHRQIESEGWTPEHDDEHDQAELIGAARCYVTAAIICENAPHSERVVRKALAQYGAVPEEDDDFLRMVEHPVHHHFGDRPPRDWPWHSDWWKPSTDPVRNLVKAGALIAAEIDRLQRAAATPPPNGDQL